MGKAHKNVKENRQNFSRKILFMRLQEAIDSFELWKHLFYENINTR
jgi:hypothetical protein